MYCDPRTDKQCRHAAPDYVIPRSYGVALHCTPRRQLRFLSRVDRVGNGGHRSTMGLEKCNHQKDKEHFGSQVRMVSAWLQIICKSRITICFPARKTRI